MTSWQPQFAGRVLVVTGASILLGSLFLTWFVLEPRGLLRAFAEPPPPQSFSGWEFFNRTDIAVTALAAATLVLLAAGMTVTRRAIPFAVLALTAVAAGAVGGYALEDVDPRERGLYVGAIASLLSLGGAMLLSAASIAAEPPRRATRASALVPLGVGLAFGSLFLPWYDGPTASSDIPREYIGWEIFSREDISIAVAAAVAVGLWGASLVRRKGVMGGRSLVVLVAATALVFGAIGRFALEAASLGAAWGVYTGAVGGVSALAGAVLMNAAPAKPAEPTETPPAPLGVGGLPSTAPPSVL